MLVSANLGGLVVDEMLVGRGLGAFCGNRDRYTRRRMGVI